MLYLIHSSVPLTTTAGREARHYLGYSREDNLWQRLRQHEAGQSNVAILKAFQAVGGELTLVRVFPLAGKAEERRLKNAGRIKLLCPLCNPPHGSRPRIPQIGTQTLIPLSSLVPLDVLKKRALRTTLSGTPLTSSGSFPVLPTLGGRIASGVDTPKVGHAHSGSFLSATAKRSKVGPT